ncbi:unnamed protein product [Choristocarpus tenellus]
MDESVNSEKLSETVEDVKARHKKELKAMTGEARGMLKQANKNKKKKAEAEALIVKMGFDLAERQRVELEKAMEHALGEGNLKDAECTGEGKDDGGNGLEGEAVGVKSAEEREREKRDQKRVKAQRKRDKQRQKEEEREQRITLEKEQGGPDPRVLEMEALAVKVTPIGLQVREIKSDGHCLYRAVAEQMALTGRCPDYTEEAFPLMREAAARRLREAPSEYIPFLEEEIGEDFEAYCNRVERTADWGGQVELQVGF